MIRVHASRLDEPRHSRGVESKLVKSVLNRDQHLRHILWIHAVRDAGIVSKLCMSYQGHGEDYAQVRRMSSGHCRARV